MRDFLAIGLCCNSPMPIAMEIALEIRTKINTLKGFRDKGRTMEDIKLRRVIDPINSSIAAIMPISFLCFTI